MSHIATNTRRNYLPQTAGSLMKPDFLLVTEDTTVAEAIGMLKGPEYYIHFYEVYICDSEGRLLGVLDIKELIDAPSQAKVGSLPYSHPISVPPDMDQEDAAEIVSKNNLVELPVVDADRRLIGVISVDDVVDVLIQETTEDIFRAGGVGHTPAAGRSLAGLSVLQHFRARMPWLLLSLVGGLIAGVIIDSFEHRLEAVILALVIFIPFVMNLGGNVGSQSATIYVRELALGSAGNARHYFLKEIAIGFAIGLTIGTVIGLIAWIWQGSAVIGLVVGTASLLTSFAASLIGVSIPWLFDHLGIDTALGSGPIVTTVKDITGLLIYFGTAIVIIRAFVP